MREGTIITTLLLLRINTSFKIKKAHNHLLCPATCVRSYYEL